MVLDIMLGAIILFSMVLGFRKGIFDTLAHTLGWAIAITCGIVFDEQSQQFIKERTHIYEKINEALTQRAKEAISDPVTSGEAIPNVIPFIKDSTLNAISEAAGTAAANVVFSILCFIMVVAAIRIVTFLLCLLFSRKHNDGVIGFFDGFLGMIMGFVRGGLIVFLFLGLMLPALAFLSPEFAQTVTDNMKDSYFSQYLYDNNILMDLLSYFKA